MSNKNLDGITRNTNQLSNNKIIKGNDDKKPQKSKILKIVLLSIFGTIASVIIITFIVVNIPDLQNTTEILNNKADTSNIQRESIRKNNESIENTNNEKDETLNSQLEDVDKKISQLPELEKDIFAKCMESTEGTVQDIKNCEEDTQNEIFILSQDLINLKNNLEKSKEEK